MDAVFEKQVQMNVSKTQFNDDWNKGSRLTNYRFKI